jgi:hypothetical protein
LERHSERKQIARAKRIAQDGLLGAETTNTSALPAPGTSSPVTVTPGTTIPDNSVPRASTSNDATSATAAGGATILTAPLSNLDLDNSTPKNPAPTPAPPGVDTPESQRIFEISREKIVSDLLEKKISPTSNEFLDRLHLELCQEFGMDPVDSPFSDQLFKTCGNFSREAANLWRKKRGNEKVIFASNRGVYTSIYSFLKKNLVSTPLPR